MLEILNKNTNFVNFLNLNLEHLEIGYGDFIQKSWWSALSNYLYYPELKLSVNTVYHSKFSLLVVDMFVTCLPFIFILGLLIVYLSISGLKIISFGANSTNVFTDVFTNLTDIDDEIGAFDDALFYFVVFTLIIAWYFMYTVFSMYFVTNAAWIFAILNLIFLIAVLTPGYIMYSFGASFPMYVRGAGRTTSFFAETFFDFIALGVMWARFLIQNIRLVLVFTAFFELFEVIYQNCDFTGASLINQLFSFNSNLNSQIYSSYWYDWFSDILLTQILLIYYWGHLTYTFMAQFANYALLSFYLFYFLYTSFILETHEKYFLFKRSI